MNPLLFQIDAFADRPFSGNPAAVCLLDQPPSNRWMQALAQEMNLSETAFVVRDANSFHLRWFTPTCEVDLCGHATLASARALWEAGWVAEGQPILFQSCSGPLQATQMVDKRIAIDLPTDHGDLCRDPDILTSLGAALGVPIVRASLHKMSFVAECASAEQILGMTPDFAALGNGPRPLIIATAKSSEARYDFISRVFCPAVGIDEDPVTGAAHCSLAPYWQSRLKKDRFQAFQASPRGGALELKLQNNRVSLCGHTLVVFQTKLNPVIIEMINE